MYDFLRKKSRTITVYVLFGAIILVFVFLRYNGMDGTSMGGGYAARVNNKTISIFEFQEAANRMSEYYSRMFGGKFDVDAQRRAMVNRSALEQLVSQELAAQGAEKAGLHVTPLEIRDMIVSVPSFQKDGKFRRDMYEAFLSYRRMTATQFEDQIRRDLLAEKTRRFINQSILTNSSGLEKEFQVKDTKLNVEFLKFEKGELLKKAVVTGAEISEYLKSEDNKKKVAESFEATKDKYSTPLEVRARHILIKTKDAASEGGALKKVQDLAKRAQTEDFGKLAKEFSEDIGSKEKNGDLGFFSAGRMVAPFEKAAFALKPGQISEPVKTEFGYHLIKLEERKEAVTKTLADVETDVARNLLQQKSVEKVNEELGKALESGNKGALDSIAARFGLKWEETGTFTMAEENVPKVGRVDSFVTTALSLSQSSPLAKNLVFDGEKTYALKLKSIEVPAKILPEADVERLRTEISSSQANDIHRNWISDLEKQAKIERNQMVLGEAPVR